MKKHRYSIVGDIIASSEIFIKNGVVIIEDNKIYEVGEFNKLKKEYDLGTIYDETNNIVMPGFVNTHSHAVQTAFRGAADDLDLLPWLHNVILPGEISLNKNQIEASCRIGYAEMLLSGITSTNDMLTSKHSLSGIRAAVDSGIRGHIGKMLMDRNVPEEMIEDKDDILKECTNYATKFPNGNRVQFAYTPRFIPACSNELMRESAIDAYEKQLIFHTHSSENMDEMKWVKELTGKSNIEALNEFGCMGQNTILAHAIWTDERETKIIKETETNISHNPSSNMKLASGIAPISDYCDEKINVGIATDGSPASGGHDFFLEMKLASFLQKIKNKNPKSLPAKDIFYMATKGGAKSLNYENVGELKKGNLADMIVLNTNNPNAKPIYDPYSFVVYSAQTRDVDKVIVNGEIRVDNGSLINSIKDYIVIAEKYKDEFIFNK